MTYKEYIKKEQEEFNKLPIFFAFGKKQFKEEMEKRGLTENDTDKIYSIKGTGGYYLKSDAQQIRDFMNRPNKLAELMNNDDFAESAFSYEMWNHEYGINWQGDWDVCSCFGKCKYEEYKDYKDYLSEMGYSDKTIKSYKRAMEKYYIEFEELNY